MSVVTKKVTGRRTVRYQNLDDLLADAEQLAAGDVRRLGNWSLGQIMEHLAKAYHGSIDGIEFRFPWPLKLMMRLFMKKKFLYGSVPPGFSIPAEVRDQVEPHAETTTEQGLAALRDSIDRLKRETHRQPHPVLGNISREEWDQFHLRHAEMHMSFLQAG